MVFKRGECDFSAEPWTKRVIFREEVDGRCGLAVSITEPVSIQKVRRFLRLTAEQTVGGDAALPLDFDHAGMV